MKVFTQAALTQEITIGPFNAAPIAAVDLIGKKLGSLISKTATNTDEVKARKDTLQEALLRFWKEQRQIAGSDAQHL